MTNKQGKGNTDEQKQERVRLCRKNLAKFVVVPDDYVILLQVMRHGFTIGRLVTSQQTKAGLAKVNHQRLWFVEANLNQKIYFLYSLNQMVLFLYIVLIKTRL